jgi:hypothetical protein
MTKLSEMIIPVRTEISDIPEDKITDRQVYDNLKDAKAYVDSIVIATATAAQLDDCYKAVACVYAYVNWTSIAERLQGSSPTTSFARIQFLREKALARLQLICTYPLNRDLTLDIKSISRLAVDGVALTESVLESYTEDTEVETDD